MTRVLASSFLASLTAQTGGFIHDATEAPLGPGLRLQARYDMARFAPGLFDQLDMRLTEALFCAVAKRQAEWLAGRLLVRAAQQALGLTVASIASGEDRAPIWPADQRGSISHARGHCACILLPEGHGHPGIDIETRAEGHALESILRITTHGPDEAMLRAAPDPGLWATLCFSAKETLYKALYPTVQRFFGFDAAQLHTRPGPDSLSLTLTEELHSSLPAGRRFDIACAIHDGHVVTWLVRPN